LKIINHNFISDTFSEVSPRAVNILFIKTCTYTFHAWIRSRCLCARTLAVFNRDIPTTLLRQSVGRITDTYLREARPAREPSLRQLSLGRSQGAISASP